MRQIGGCSTALGDQELWRPLGTRLWNSLGSTWVYGCTIVASFAELSQVGQVVLRSELGSRWPTA